MTSLEKIQKSSQILLEAMAKETERMKTQEILLDQDEIEKMLKQQFAGLNFLEYDWIFEYDTCNDKLFVSITRISKKEAE